MPWCPECDRFLSPATVTPEGSCPRCGFPVEPGRARAPDAGAAPSSAQAARAHPGRAGDASPEDAPHLGAAGAAGEAGGADDADGDGLPSVPWHLKLMVGALVVYLGWRAFEGIEWAVRQL